MSESQYYVYKGDMRNDILENTVKAVNCLLFLKSKLKITHCTLTQCLLFLSFKEKRKCLETEGQALWFVYTAN